jgi:hypothetical protein
MADIKKIVDPWDYTQEAVNNNSQNNVEIAQALFQIDLVTPLFFKQPVINEALWNQALPYQLQILDASKNYKILASFTLPITPQEFSISTPFAVTVTPTFAGIVEEHGGAPFRMISVRSSFGVTVLRPQANALSADADLNASIGSVIFAGTASAVSNVGTAVQSISNKDLNASNVFKKTTTSDIDPSNLKAFSTGFFQYHILKEFLETYAELKTSSQNNDLRLGFARYKDSSTYIVTPVRFDINQSVSSPLEITYSLVLKAWARISTDRPVNPTPALKKPASKKKLIVNALAKIEEVRQALLGSQEILLALRSDIKQVLFEPLRETALFCKDAVSTSVAVYELPANLVLDLQSSVVRAWGDVGVNINRQGVSFDPDVIFGLFDRAYTVNKALYSAQNPRATLAVYSRNVSAADPLNSVFEHPDVYHDLFRQLPLGSLTIAPSISRSINQEVQRVRQFDYPYFSQTRDNLQALADNLANALGIGSDTYDRVTGSPLKAPVRTATDADYEMLYNIQQAVDAYDLLALQARQAAINVIPPSINYVANLAAASGIQYDVPTSKFAVPFPYGATIEQLALQYLGDANRALEIVTLNGLNEPYVDETGFTLPFLSNGSNNLFFVSDATNLRVGSSVYVYSNNVPQFLCHVLSIQQQGTSWAITVDQSVSNLLVSQQAVIRAYLPNTLSSQKLVFIPSFKPAQENTLLASLPGVNNYDGLLNVGGVTLLLDNNNDIVVTNNSGTRWAFGLQVLVQSARAALSTPLGALLQHPGFGIDLGVGETTADITADDLLQAATNLFANDARFSKVLGVAVTQNGPVTRLTITLQVTGTNHTLPLAVDFV